LLDLNGQFWLRCFGDWRPAAMTGRRMGTAWQQINWKNEHAPGQRHQAISLLRRSPAAYRLFDTARKLGGLWKMQ
jgi:hypothetical protein